MLRDFHTNFAMSAYPSMWSVGLLVNRLEKYLVKIQKRMPSVMGCELPTCCVQNDDSKVSVLKCLEQF